MIFYYPDGDGLKVVNGKLNFGYDSYQNTVARKVLRNGRTCVWLINVIMNQLVEDKISIE